MTKTARWTMALALLLSLASFPAAAADPGPSAGPHPGLSDSERAEVIALLEDSRRQFEELTARSTGDAWNQAPAEDKWSVGEVAEHLVLAEETLLAMIQGALEGEMDPDWETVAATPIAGLVAMVTDRSQKFQAPDGLRPVGTGSRAELLEKFGLLRARTLDFARTIQAPLKRFTAEGPPGKMTTHQHLALIGAHNLRHNAQIAEAQAMLEAR